MYTLSRSSISPVNKWKSNTFRFIFKKKHQRRAEPRRPTAKTHKNPELLVFVTSFYCSWDLPSVYKTRADCKASMGRWAGRGWEQQDFHLFALQRRRRAASMIVQSAVSHSQCRCLRPVCSRHFTSCKCKTAPPISNSSSSSNLLQTHFVLKDGGWA